VEPDPVKAGYPRAVTILPDGRLAISAEHGLWVGIEGSWTRVREGDSADVAVDGSGRLWVGPRDGSGLVAYGETATGWEPGPSCPGGGGITTAGPDGVVWSAKTGLQSPIALLRVNDSRCEEIVIAPDATAEVLALAADPGGGITAVLDSRTGGKVRTQVVHWADGTRTMLRDLAAGTDRADVAYAPGGTLWMTRNAGLSSYAAGVWTDVTGTGNAELNTTVDGTVWYFDELAGLQPVGSAVP
jgi:hypothetical protein